MSEIETTISGISPEIANLIAEAPPPPITTGVVPSAKEQRTAIKGLEREADAFGRAGIDRTVLRKFGEIARLVPGANRIRIHKRKDGNLAYIGEYSFRDMQSTGDTEGFIAKHIKPVHGPGEYAVTIIDSNGREFPSGSVFIEGVPQEVQGGGMVDLVRDLLRQQPQQVQPDPLEAMRRAQAFAQELKASGGGDQNALVMALLATQKPQGPDPILLATLERLSAKVEKLEGGGPGLGALPPPMPPAPTVDWVSLGAQVIVPLLGQWQQAQQAQQNQQMQMQMELQKMQMQQAQAQMQMMQALMTKNDGFTAKDVLSMQQESQNRMLDVLQRQREEERPQNTIEDQMTALLKMKEFTQAFSPPPPAAPQGASFWDALVALASSQDMAGALAERIRSRQAQVTESRQLPENGGPPENGGATVYRMPSRRPDPQLQPPQQAPAQPRIEIPPMLKDDCAKIVMAGDTPSRVQAVVETLMRLRATNFGSFVEALLAAMLQNDKEKTLRGLGSWLKLCIDSGLLPKDTAVLALKDFAENWDLIRDMLGERLPPALRATMVPAQSAPATTPAPEAPPAPDAPAAPPAPSPASDPSIPSDFEMPEGYGDSQEPAGVV